jgi:hypothetical protein
MSDPQPLEHHVITTDTEALRSYAPVPGFGILPVNAFLIRASEPMLVDTGMIGERDAFMAGLRSVIAPEDLRWIWLTHTDADHMGSIAQVLAEAPHARVITTYLGMGKLNLHQLPVDRVYLLNPGQSLDIGDRQVVAVKPPTYDAPETTGLFDTKNRYLYSADSFGALLTEPVESAAALSPKVLREGLVTWATVDAPWLGSLTEYAFAEVLSAVAGLQPSAILSSHLPPAIGMLETMLEHLAAAQKAPTFIGPDQAALEQMMAGAQST